MPLTLEALMAICEQHGLQVKWFDEEARGGSPPGGALIRSRFEAPGTVLVNRRLRSQEGRLKYELAFFIGHKVLHNGDGAISPHSACIRGRRGIELRRRHGCAGRAVCVAGFRMQFLRGCSAVPAHSVSPIF